MSISLSRISNIKRVEFNVCLNFRPSVFCAEMLGFDGQKNNLSSAEYSLEEYKPINKMEEEYDPAFVIKCRINHRPLLVAVHYQC